MTTLRSLMSSSGLIAEIGSESFGCEDWLLVMRAADEPDLLSCWSSIEPHTRVYCTSCRGTYANRARSSVFEVIQQRGEIPGGEHPSNSSATSLVRRSAAAAANVHPPRRWSNCWKWHRVVRRCRQAPECSPCVCQLWACEAIATIAFAVGTESVLRTSLPRHLMPKDLSHRPNNHQTDTPSITSELFGPNSLGSHGLVSCQDLASRGSDKVDWALQQFTHLEADVLQSSSWRTEWHAWQLCQVVHLHTNWRLWSFLFLIRGKSQFGMCMWPIWQCEPRQS